MKKFLFYCLVFILSTSAFSQITKADHYNTIDNKLFEYNKNNPPFDSIVAFVNKNFISQEDKIRAYYSWIATNVEYDVDHLNKMLELLKINVKTISGDSQNADTVFIKRKAVCEGFSLLFNKFCSASSIPSFMAVGYTKLPNGEVYTEIHHAWNVVRSDSNWHLIDVTWSGGYVNSMNQYVKRFSDKYFFSTPDDFLKDHLPLDPMWQLKNDPLSKNKFFGLQDTLPSAFINYNDSINNYAKVTPKKQKQTDFVHYYLFDPLNPEFQLEMDRVVNNIAADYLSEASLHYDLFLTFQSKKMGKHPTIANCKKAKAILEVPKQDLIKAINYLKVQKAFTKEFEVIFKEMITNANTNLTSIKQTIDAVNSYMKSIGGK